MLGWGQVGKWWVGQSGLHRPPESAGPLHSHYTPSTCVLVPPHRSHLSALSDRHHWGHSSLMPGEPTLPPSCLGSHLRAAFPGVSKTLLVHWTVHLLSYTSRALIWGVSARNPEEALLVGTSRLPSCPTASNFKTRALTMENSVEIS